ncbi:MAG: tol-pal system protein YbgF [Pseudomonadota bacterium]|nr:tol-pal system protein YbgF [Pseudomonadota bacterium]
MRGRTHFPAALAAVLWLSLAFAGTAHAGLFDDDEARKAIIDLRNRATQLETQGKARNDELATVNTQLVDQVATMRRSLLELNNQIESLRGELAKLRGNDEQVLRDVAEVQRKQQDLSQSIDDRLRKLEPSKVSVDSREFVAGQDERKAYDDALETIRGGDFDQAVNKLQAFQKRYPQSGFMDSSRFWLGNALYGKRDYKEAISVFRGFVTASPDHPRAPEALLALANSQAEMKDAKAARKTIDELLKRYPESEAAKTGKQRLASIK